MVTEHSLKRRKKKKRDWKRDDAKHVRDGWKRHTTYYRIESIIYLQEISTSTGQFLMDVIEDVINYYRKKHG